MNAQGQCVPAEQNTDRIIKEDDVQDTGPNFASSGEAVDFVGRAVRTHGLGNGTVTVANGVSSFNSSSSYSGPVFVPHEDQTVETFDDKLSLLLGGRAGFFTFQGNTVCVSDDGCELPASAPQAADPAGDPLPSAVNNLCDGEFCTDNTATKIQLGFFCSIGAETRQSSGGYHEETHFCWKWHFLPWVCTSKTGTNRFQHYVLLPLARTGPNMIENIDKSEQERNVSVKKTKFWSILDPSGPECLQKVLCNQHTSSGNSSSSSGPDNRFTFAQTGFEITTNPPSLGQCQFPE